MNDEQRRAFEYVGSLLTFYGDYRTKKEREAYVVSALYLGATGAVLTSDLVPKDARLALLLVGLAVATMVVATLVRWQLKNLRFAARIVGASVNISSRWLQQPPSSDAMVATPLAERPDVLLPADVAEAFNGQQVPWVRRAQFAVPVLLAVWGASVVAVLWWTVGGADNMPGWKWLLLVGLAASFFGVAILTWTAGVPWILPDRFRTMWDVWLWRLGFALVLLGTLLQFVGTLLSP